MPKFTLHYFGLYARGEPIRMILDHAKADWEDHRIGFEEWPSLKPTMPGGQLPVLERDDGTKMTQSMALVRYLGGMYGLIPDDDLQAARVDELCEAYVDV